MYGLPKDTDLSFLTDREVIQVCFGLYQIQLHFDKDVSISIEGKLNYQFRDEQPAIEWTAGKTTEAAALVGLLSAKVEKFWIEAEGTLRLKFSTGSILTIFDSKDKYESYDIFDGNSSIIV